MSATSQHLTLNADEREKLPRTIHINAAASARRLNGIGIRLPPSIWQQSPFELRARIQPMELLEKGTGKLLHIMDEEIQAAHWLASVASAADQSEWGGWNMCIAGQYSNFGLGDSLACKLAAAALVSADARVEWFNLGDSLKALRARKDAWEQDQVSAPPRMLVVTGLRWEAPSARWDMAADLLNSGPPQAARVLVGVGRSPKAMMTRIGLPLHRVLNLGTVPNTAEL